MKTFIRARIATMPILIGCMTAAAGTPAAAQSYSEQIKDCGKTTRCSSDHVDSLYRARDAEDSKKREQAFAVERQEMAAQAEGDKLSRLQQVMRRRRAAAAAANNRK